MNPVSFTRGPLANFRKRARKIEETQSPSHSLRPDGFTLIELLVVIAIIAILAAILLPVLAHAKLKATQAYCINNQKELATAFIMYVNDNRETLPNPNNAAGNPIWPGTSIGGGFWGINRSLPPCSGATGIAGEGVSMGDVQGDLMTNNLLFQYAGNVGSYHCPGDVRFNEPVGSGSAIGWAYDSYAIPENVEPGSTSDTDGNSKMAAIRRVADCMIFVEQADTRGYNNGTFAITANIKTPGSPIGYEDVFSMYHGDVGTFAFADGHAEAHRWINATIIGDGLASVAPGSVDYQYSACPGGTGALPQKGPDVGYLLQHCVSPTDP